MQAYRAFKEIKNQLDGVCKEAKARAADKQAKNEAEDTYKRAVKEAEKARDDAINQATATFRVAWEKAEKEFRAAMG